jgi:putative nucleotidyltransferase with HDIG domain
MAVGAATLGLSLFDSLTGAIDRNWLWLAALTLASGSATVHLRSYPVAVSVSETFVFTSAILFGPSAGTLTLALDAAVISFWSYRNGQPFFKIVFNLTALPLTIWIAAHAFFASADFAFAPVFGHEHEVSIASIFWPLMLFTFVYFVLSSSMLTVAISLERKLPPLRVWRANFVWLSLNYFGGASVAAVLVLFAKQFDYRLLLIIVPLLAVLYATYATSIGRVHDANRHLTELNSLYMSTIETLAMAIDAKDQVTHGHIRRVQSYAVGLARALGVRDDAIIRAVEAAALLHDMGKLAVPEYILNKPGPLTPAEFDKMKLHASVGADILSSINFPYPVVPIVRHHHENWDGTGYPDGLRAGEIPLGARILSVVDCFDALTSDRPYRPRLSDDEALEILRDRRGTMYDPLIVDTFLDVFSTIPVETVQPTRSTETPLAAIARRHTVQHNAVAPSLGFEDIAASTEEMLVLYDLARGLTGHCDLADAGDVIAKHLRRIVPASTCVFYVYSPDKDRLVAAHAEGENACHFSGLSIARGERLTGWVAANLRTIVNSDPVLDLGDVARSFKPRLRSCLSAPLTTESELIGVLSVYSTQAEAFTDDHRRIIEVVARQVSHTVKHALEFEREKASILRDELTGLPTLERVSRIVDSELRTVSPVALLSIIHVAVTDPASPTELHASSETAILTTVSAIRSTLRGADILFRYSADGLVVLLMNTDPVVAELVADRIADRLRVGGGQQLPAAKVGYATAPNDGTTLEELLCAAQSRQPRRYPQSRPPLVH